MQFYQKGAHKSGLPGSEGFLVIITPMKYHVWTEGCQMNVADSERVSSALEHLGYEYSPVIEEADVIILNTCVVRASAEEKAYGRLTSLLPVKRSRPEVVINLMGCLVGINDNPALRKRFPYVDVFSPPSDPSPLVEYLLQRDARTAEEAETARRYALMDGDILLPHNDPGNQVVGWVPVVYGCSHACAYCIIPYRRGVEKSRPPEEILREARSLDVAAEKAPPVSASRGCDSWVLAGAGFTSGTSDILLREKKGNMDPMNERTGQATWGKAGRCGHMRERLRAGVPFSPGSSKRPRHGVGPSIKK